MDYYRCITASMKRHHHGMASANVAAFERMNGVLVANCEDANSQQLQTAMVQWEKSGKV